MTGKSDSRRQLPGASDYEKRTLLHNPGSDLPTLPEGDEHIYVESGGVIGTVSRLKPQETNS